MTATLDGSVQYSIVTGDPTSDDVAYNNLTAASVADVSVTNTDNDSPAVIVTPTTGLVTTEAGGTASFTVCLNGAPTATVTITLSLSDGSEGGLSRTTLTFTPGQLGRRPDRYDHRPQ